MSEAIDLKSVEQAVTDLLKALGEDPTRPGLVDTPKRVAKAWQEMLNGQAAEPVQQLETVFESHHSDLVIVRDIGFESVCEHHLLPFKGVAHIGYIPRDGKVVGLSKLARLVDGYAHRLQLQEKLTNQIADALQEALDPIGVGVVMEAEHTCMSVRGVRQRLADTVTIAGRGECAPGGSHRADFLALLGNPHVDGDHE
ncbi:GTP cyclohydrolase I FolE [Boudabousia marimammalium]|uniref:GTP cyclohydrolase 1 n=1 Tax=Boudabousia marimammalium TaxID=156892 RepID=A0A1Q5PME4_9ACTO|nr:GTP cyclohydrolase I FolE [Boudabousia marimammalium]OKL48693.1 GTP cyclohydrolase I FolE [Boudabousia marimammalium]